MKIVVCIKQVPGTTTVDIDPETGVLKRSGVPSKMNPYDLYALETALRLKNQHGGTITVVSMGPPQAEAVIKEAYMMGADSGVLLCDIGFAGADVLATSYTISEGIKALGSFDLIICGKQTTDGDTAQVGPAIAEHLRIPHVTWVSEIESSDQAGIVVEQNMADSFEVVRLEFPCLITVEKDIYTPRLPSYLNLLKTKEWPVNNLCITDLPSDSEDSCGLNGSPTKVERIFAPSNDIEQTIWNCADTDCAQELYDMLKSEKYLGGN